MNTIFFFFRGILIGLSIAAPVGPIGVLCIRRTLVEGALVGLLSGLGAATADAIYGMIAGFGLTLLSAILVGQVFWFQLVGGLFLVYLGVTTAIAPPAQQEAKTQSNRGLLGAYLSTLLLTLTNPLTIASFAAVFAGLGLAKHTGEIVSTLLLVLGVFLGSALWWLVLSGSVSLLRAKINLCGLRWVNRIAGIVLVAFGAIALTSLGWSN